MGGEGVRLGRDRQPRRKGRPYVPGTEADSLEESAGNAEGPLHQPRLAKHVARTGSRLLRKPRAGAGRVHCSRLALGRRKPERAEGDAAG